MLYLAFAWSARDGYLYINCLEALCNPYPAIPTGAAQPVPSITNPVDSLPLLVQGHNRQIYNIVFGSLVKLLLSRINADGFLPAQNQCRRGSTGSTSAALPTSY